MFLLKLVAKAIKVLNSETTARALALAASLGMVLGLVPMATLQWFLVAMVVLFFRVNLTAALFSMAMFKLLSLALRGTFDSIGVSLLESDGLVGLWTSLYDSPLYFLGTHHSITLGATLAAAVLAGPIYVLGLLGVGFWRRTISERWTRLGVVNAWRGSKLYRLYRFIDSPFGG